MNDQVVSVLAQLLEKLPEEFFLEEDEQSDDEEEEALDGDEKVRRMNSIRRQVVREMLTTERSFVMELELLQVCVPCDSLTPVLPAAAA